MFVCLCLFGEPPASEGPLAMEGYETLGVLGEGTYGVVVKARHRATGRLVAIKKYKQAEDDDHVRKTSLREVRVLKQLRHPNVISLLDVFRRDGKLYLVFEFVENTILQLIELKRHGLSPGEVRRYTYQLLNGVDYCHAHNIIHRDVKPENILVSKDGLLKLCDFGFARQLSSRGRYTDYVATRWYRAPELLVGDVSYGKAVDIWAIGCIFSELSDGQPLFPGDSDLDQLSLIMRTCGPVPDRMVDIFERNSLYRRVMFPVTHVEQALRQRFQKCSDSWLEFLTSCLRTDPTERPSCAALMNLPYFTEDNFRAEYDAELRGLFQQYQTPAVDASTVTTPTLVQPKAQLFAGEPEEVTELVLPLLAMSHKGLESADRTLTGNKGTSVSVSACSGGNNLSGSPPFQQLGTLWSHYLGTTTTTTTSTSTTGELPSIGGRPAPPHNATTAPLFNNAKNTTKVDHKEGQEMVISSLHTMKVAGGPAQGTSNSSTQQQGLKVSGATQNTSTTLRGNWKSKNAGDNKGKHVVGWKSDSLKKSIKLNHPVFPALPSGCTSPVPPLYTTTNTTTGTTTTTSNVAFNALSVLRDGNANAVPRRVPGMNSNTVSTVGTTSPTARTPTPTPVSTPVPNTTVTANVPTTSSVGAKGGAVNTHTTRHKKKRQKSTPMPGGTTEPSPKAPSNLNLYHNVSGQKCSFHDLSSKR